MDKEGEDICGLCGKPGADKYKHPVRWPGEINPEGEQEQYHAYNWH
jgi:hypothetical protein